eukprot:366370-Chlamydomonas_euryale.AAC.5
MALVSLAHAQRAHRNLHVNLKILDGRHPTDEHTWSSYERVYVCGHLTEGFMYVVVLTKGIGVRSADKRVYACGQVTKGRPVPHGVPPELRETWLAGLLASFQPLHLHLQRYHHLVGIELRWWRVQSPSELWPIWGLPLGTFTESRDIYGIQGYKGDTCIRQCRKCMADGAAACCRHPPFLGHFL